MEEKAHTRLIRKPSFFVRIVGLPYRLMPMFRAFENLRDAKIEKKKLDMNEGFRLKYKARIWRVDGLRYIYKTKAK